MSEEKKDDTQLIDDNNTDFLRSVVITSGLTVGALKSFNIKVGRTKTASIILTKILTEFFVNINPRKAFADEIKAAVSTTILAFTDWITSSVDLRFLIAYAVSEYVSTSSRKRQIIFLDEEFWYKGYTDKKNDSLAQKINITDIVNASYKQRLSYEIGQKCFEVTDRAGLVRLKGFSDIPTIRTLDDANFLARSLYNRYENLLLTPETFPSSFFLSTNRADRFSARIEAQFEQEFSKLVQTNTLKINYISLPIYSFN